jgi:hypothetical protein
MKTISIEQRYAERVARGVTWLDATASSWLDVINTNSLVMKFNNQCVIGQVCPQELNFTEMEEMFGVNWIIHHGFDIPHTNDWNVPDNCSEKFKILTDEWKRIISELRATK